GSGAAGPAGHEEDEHAAHGAPAHPTSAQSHGHDAHGPGEHLHDAPPAMALALVVLAIGSVVAGYVGLPHALGGHNSLGEWLAPAFQAVNAPQVAREVAESATVGEEGSLELTL